MGNGVAGLGALAVDCADPPALAMFWQRLLGGEVVVDEDGDVELLGGPVEIYFLKVAEAKAGRSRLHLDLHSSESDAVIELALDAGATRAQDVYVGDRWQVLRDPEGNEFCIRRPDGDAASPTGAGASVRRASRTCAAG